LDHPNTKLNHAKDPLEVPSGPNTRAFLKKTLNELIQNIWSKTLKELGTPMEHEGQPIIQKEPNYYGLKGC